jgi:DNA-binding NtrC family response regulator
MTVRVLVADDDLDVHELVNDILLITFKDVLIERVLSVEACRAKLSSQIDFDLLLVASGLSDENDTAILAMVLDEFPAMVSKIAVIEEAGASARFDNAGKPLPLIKKPFSLDEFSDVIKKICRV